MKKIFILLCFIAGVAFSGSSQETASQAKIDSLENVIKTLQTIQKQSVRESLETEDKHKKELTDARELADSLKQRVIALEKEKEETVKRCEARNDSMQRQLISIASNFLYVPYDAYAIDKLAIPAFNGTQGSPYFDKYKIRLELLQNYRGDVEALIAYTTTLLEKPETGIDHNWKDKRTEKRAEVRNGLLNLSLVNRYKQYEDWQETWLGSRIANLEKYLQADKEEKTADKIKTMQTGLKKSLSD